MPIVKKNESGAPRATSGWGAVAKRTTELAAQKERGENQVPEFWLSTGETAQIQFLSAEPYCYYAHQLKDKNGRWRIIPCQLNTQKSCELCNSGSKQTWKAAFKILDYRGTWDKDKRIFKHDKQIEKVWIVGATIAQQLKEFVDRKGKSLTSFVIEVSRSGSGTNSTYNFQVALDDDDQKMIPIEFESKTPSLDEICRIPTDSEIMAYL